MPKEQIRIKLPEQADRLQDYGGRKAHLVYRNGKSVLLLELKLQGQSLIGKNTRLQKMEVRIEELDEVLLDEVKQGT